MAMIGAAMCKLIHLAYGVLKNGRPFDPEMAKTAWLLRQYLTPGITGEQRCLRMRATLIASPVHPNVMLRGFIY